MTSSKSYIIIHINNNILNHVICIYLAFNRAITFIHFVVFNGVRLDTFSYRHNHARNNITTGTTATTLYITFTRDTFILKAKLYTIYFNFTRTSECTQHNRTNFHNSHVFHYKETSNIVNPIIVMNTRYSYKYYKRSS